MKTKTKEVLEELTFPLRGVDLTTDFGRPRPMTTQIGNNVRTYESITGRGRGGSRSGLTKLFVDRVTGDQGSGQEPPPVDTTPGTVISLESGDPFFVESGDFLLTES